MLLLNRIWQEKRLYKNGDWVKHPVLEKKTDFELELNDGAPEYTVKCEYRFNLDGRTYIGNRAYFGSKSIGLSPEECDQLRKQDTADEKTIHYLKNMPEVNVGYMLYPKKLDQRAFYLAITIVICSSFFVFLLLYYKDLVK